MSRYEEFGSSAGQTGMGVRDSGRVRSVRFGLKYYRPGTFSDKISAHFNIYKSSLDHYGAKCGIVDMESPTGCLQCCYSEAD